MKRLPSSMSSFSQKMTKHLLIYRLKTLILSSYYRAIVELFYDQKALSILVHALAVQKKLNAEKCLLLHMDCSPLAQLVEQHEI
jgi:hypothetical protein